MLSAVLKKQSLNAAVLASARRSFASAAAANPQVADADEIIEIDLPESSFEGYLLDVPDLTYKTTKSTLLQMYKDMIVTRRMEMACDALYKAKKIRGFCHLCVGQEAIPVGIEYAITKRDTCLLYTSRCV